jgi:hypothetical protein
MNREPNVTPPRIPARISNTNAPTDDSCGASAGSSLATTITDSNEHPGFDIGRRFLGRDVVLPSLLVLCPNPNLHRETHEFGGDWTVDGGDQSFVMICNHQFGLASSSCLMLTASSAGMVRGRAEVGEL